MLHRVAWDADPRSGPKSFFREERPCERPERLADPNESSRSQGEPATSHRQEPPVRFASSLLVVLVLLLPVPSAAQLPFDLRGGVNLTQFVTEGGADADERRGLSLGAGVTPLRFGPVSILLEGYYRQKGGGFQTTAAGGAMPEQWEIGLDYVEVPVLLRLTVPLGGSFGLHVQGGPVFAWQIDCGVTVGAGGSSTPSCEDLLGGSAAETLRDYEQGITGGVGVELLVLGGAGAITLDAVAIRGLSRLTEAADGPDLKNRGVSLMLGYSFNPSLGAMLR